MEEEGCVVRVQVISKKAFPSGRICTSANYQNLSLFTRSTNICVSACDGEAYEVGVDGAVSSLDATLRYVTTHPGAAYTCAAGKRVAWARHLFSRPPWEAFGE